MLENILVSTLAGVTIVGPIGVLYYGLHQGKKNPDTPKAA